MNGKILKSAFKNTWTSPQGVTIHYHDLEVESDGNKMIGTIGCKEITPEWITAGKELEFNFDAEKKKFTKQQPQGQGKPYGGGGNAGFKPNEAQWIGMQRSIAAQSAAHTAFEYAKGNDKVDSDKALILAGKIFDFVIGKSELK